MASRDQPHVEDPIFWLVPRDSRASDAVAFTPQESRVVDWNGHRVFSVGWHVKNACYEGVREREIATFGRVWLQNDFLFPSDSSSSISRIHHFLFAWDETVKVFLLRTRSQATTITSPAGWDFSEQFGGVRQMVILPDYDIRFSVGEGDDIATFQIIWNRRSPAEWEPPTGKPVVPDLTITNMQIARAKALRDHTRQVPWASYRPAVVRSFRQGSYGKLSEVIDLHTCRPMIVKEFFRDNLNNASFHNIFTQNNEHNRHPYVSLPRPAYASCARSLLTLDRNTLSRPGTQDAQVLVVETYY
jgi:hypothetical protein